MDTKDFAASLRTLALWYDEHPDAPVSDAPSMCVSVHDDKAEVVRLARMLAPCDKRFETSTFALTRRSGGIELSFLFWRSTVCEKHVVGTKVVPAQPERTVEIVEWDCGSILEETTEAPA